MKTVEKKHTGQSEMDDEKNKPKTISPVGEGVISTPS